MGYNLNVPKEPSAGLITRFNAPLHHSSAEPSPQGPNIDSAVNAYLDAGVSSDKLASHGRRCICAQLCRS